MRHLRAALLVASVILSDRAFAQRLGDIRWPVPAGSLVMANAYGDTAWFESRTIRRGHGPHVTRDFKGSVGPVHVVTPWARSLGTPLLLVTPWREPLEPALDVAGRWCARTITRGHVFPDWEGRSVVYEPGWFGSTDRPATFGWDLKCAASDSSRLRLVFFVIGRAVGGTPPGQPRQASGDPTPIQTDRHRRYFEIDSVDCRATLRIVGDVQVDLANARIAPSDAAAVKR